MGNENRTEEKNPIKILLTTWPLRFVSTNSVNLFPRHKWDGKKNGWEVSVDGGFSGQLVGMRKDEKDFKECGANNFWGW